MVDPHTCPVCGNTVEVPIYFGYARQRVFEFVWNNPGCTMSQIKFGVYGREIWTNVVSVHLSHIARELRSTPYYLWSEPMPSKDYKTNRPRKYYIKGNKTLLPTSEGISNGAIDLDIGV